MELHAFILSLLLLTIVSDTESRSLDNSLQCATTCEDPVNFAYSVGYTYQYTYNAVVTSSFYEESTEGQRSTVQIQASLLVDVLTPCELVLRVTQASIDTPGVAEWERSLLSNPLHFNLQDGKIPEICASNNDPAWVLNIKRGMLSAFQVSTVEEAGNVREVDVTGDCQSFVDVETSGNTKVFTKQKDYNTCAGRDQHLLFSHFTPYPSDSPRQNFIYSQQTCTQQVRGLMLYSTVCSEQHTFRPFSTSESGARTSITQHLTYSGKSRTYGAEQLGNSDARRTTLAFDNEKVVRGLSSDISELQTLFTSVCHTMSLENYKQVAQDFIQMVFLLRKLDVSALQQSYSALDGACPQWESALKEMFRDSLQWCGSEGCVVFQTRLIAAGTDAVDDDTAARWLTGMSMITQPTQSMLEGLTAVARNGRLKEKAYLTTGTLIHKICSSESTNCLTQPIVSTAVDFFQDKLGYNCRTTNPESKKEILLALRSLGNAGRFSAINTISACAVEPENDMETRISAVEAFRRLPCNSDRSAISRIVFNNELDAELRISSFLAMMQCPTPSFISQINAMLDTEPVRQVASFVWTHFHKMLESTDPLKGYLKALLHETAFSKKYDLDPRKYSRFYETSLFSEQLNAGATIESSLIWSTKSFVPRSANLNFTVDVFGQAVNLFEVGGRVEGVETLIQSFMGPKGFLKNNPLSDLFMAPDDEPEDEEVEVLDEERSSRSTDDTRLVELQTQYKTGLNTENKPNANWYLRVFGNEMFYRNSRDSAPLTAESGSVNILPLMQQLAEGGEYHYHDDSLIVNSAHVLPTGVGLPLTVAFNGSASIDVNANGRLDMTGLFGPSPQLSVVGSILPRAVIYMTGSMTIDAHVHQSGIATESAAETSWTLGGSVSLERGQRLSMRLDAPFERNTVFRFSHKLMKIAGNEVTTMVDNSLGYARDTCTTEYAGHRMCYNYYHMSGTNPIFPVESPVVISAYLEKTDLGFDHYILDGTYTPTYTNGMIPSALEATLIMDTPNSNVNRRTTLDITYNTEDMTMSARFARPGTDVRLDGLMENSPNAVTASLTYNKNGAQTQFRTVLEKSRSGNEHQWSTLTTLQTPTKTITGNAVMIIDPQRRAVLNMSLDNVMPTPISLHLNLQDNTEDQSRRLRYSGSVDVGLPGVMESGLRFNMNIKPKSDVFIFGLNYAFTGMEEERFYFHHKRRDHSTSSLTSWDAEQKFTFTRFPSFNHHVEISYSNAPGALSSNVKIGYGRHAGHDGNTRYMQVGQDFSYQTSSANRELQGRVEILVPMMSVNYVADINHSDSPTSVSTRVNVGSYGMQFSMNDRTALTGLMNKDISLQIPTPWGTFHATDSIVETSRNVYQINGELGVGGTNELSMSGETTIVNQADLKSINIRVYGSDNQDLFRASSVNRFLQPAGFSTENSLESNFNNLIMVNLRHEGAKEGGFESNLMLKHNPDKYLEISIDSENMDTVKRLARVSFKDHVGVTRFVQLQAAKSNLENNGATTFHANASFTNNIPAISVKNLAGRMEVTNSPSNSAVHTSVLLNDAELVGADATHSYTIQDSETVHTGVVVQLRQAASQAYPRRLQLNTDVTNTISSGHTVSAHLTQDGQEKLATTFTIREDNRNFRGEVQQSYNANLPSDATFDATILPNGINIDLEVDRSSGRLNLVKNRDSSVTLTMSHSNRMLVDQGVPRSVLATLTWGELRGGQVGVMLSGNVNREDFSMKLAYSSSEDQPFYVAAIVAHEVRTLESLPQIRLVVRVYGTTGNGGLEAYFNVDDRQMWSLSATREGQVLQFSALQTCAIMTAMHIPGTIKAIYKTIVTTADITYLASMKVNELFTEGSVVLAADSLRLQYFSNCTCIGGQFDVQFNYPQDRTGGTITLRLADSRQATISAEFSKPLDLSVNWDQSLYVVEEMPNLPRTGLMQLTLSPTSATIRGEYNDYRVRLTGATSDISSPDMMVFDWTLEQNITPEFSSLTTHHEISYVPGSISNNAEYSFDNGLDRFVKMSAGYGETEGEENGLQINVAYSHNEPILTTAGVPEDIKVVVSGTPIGMGFTGAVVATVDRNMRKIQLTTGIDMPTKTVRFSFSHDLSSLSELGVFNNLTAHLQCTPTVRDGEYRLETRSFVQVNEDQYSASLGGSFVNSPDDSRVRVTTDASHEIPILYTLNIPQRLQTNTVIEYGMSNGLSGSSSIASTVTRTMYNLDTEETTDVVNYVNARAHVELFNYNLALSGSHDFDVSFMPHNIKYEIAAAGSGTQGTGILYKSLMMAVTVDGRKQMASVTLNQNQNERSFYLSSSHNVTAVYKYGIPGNMSISIRRIDDYNADVSLVYDTAKKSVGFKFDYDGHRNKVVFYVNHNFDTLVQMFYIPKSMGFETFLTKTVRNADWDLKYVWGPLVKVGHVTVTWEPDFSAVSYRIRQNITAEDNWYFPRNSQMAFVSNYFDRGFNFRLSAFSKVVTLTYDTSTTANMPVAARITLTQNYDLVKFPRTTSVEVDLDRSVANTEKLILHLSMDREEKLATTITAKYNLQQLSGSVAVQNQQEFVTNDIFPSSIDFFANCSVNYEFTSYVTLERDDLPRFMASVKTGVNVAENSASVELIHSQRIWKKAGVPKKVQLDISYNPEEKSVDIAVRLGRNRNNIRATADYRLTSDLFYGHLEASHDFENTQIPSFNQASVLLEKGATSFGANYNVTLGSHVVTHSVEGMFTRTATSFTGKFENRQYSNVLETVLPHTVGALVSADWTNGFTSLMTTTYGDKTTKLRLTSNMATNAELNFRHNWEFLPNSLQIILTKPADEQSVNMAVNIDGVERQIEASGSFNEGRGDAQFMHNFEGTQIPQMVTLSGNYRMKPDMYVQIHAMIDGQEHTFSGGFEPLDGGFRITSTLLDDITRTATFRRNLVPGGFSFNLDHNIPELVKYIPGTIGASASARLNPRPNITASFHQATRTRAFTAEADLTALRFSFNHDFEMIPLPRSVNLEMSGSMTPVSGSVTLTMDGQQRAISASVDPNNMVANMMNSFPQIPLPESLSVSLRGSAAPLSGGITVNLNGLERTMDAEMDTTRMRGRIQQSVAELNFVPRDIVFGVSGSAQPLSGEIYLTMDGLERRAGGSMNRPGGIISVFHTVPELSYIPRNISFRMSGSMQPLNGQLSLTIDEVERSVSAEVNTRSIFALTHSVPEVEPYIPRHLSISGGFTANSGRLAVQYDVNRVTKSVNLGATFTANHLRLQASQSVNTARNVPRQIVVELSGSMENKNFTVLVDVDEISFDLNGEVYTGARDGWYGISLTSLNNIPAFTETLALPRNMETTLKARKDGPSYELAATINLFQDHDYTSLTTFTPIKTRLEKAIRASYEHHYSGMTRSVGGSATVSTDDEGHYTMTVNGQQSQPERRQMQTTVTASATAATFSGSHNIPEFTAIGIPTELRNGRASVSMDREANTARVAAQATIEGTIYGYSLDLSSEIQGGRMIFNAIEKVRNAEMNKRNEGTITYNKAANGDIVTGAAWNVRDLSTSVTEVDEEVSLELRIAPATSSSITLNVRHALLNEIGVPRQTSLTFVNREPRIPSVNWIATFQMDEMSLVSTTEFHMSNELPFHVDFKWTMGNTISYLTDLSVPSSMSILYAANYNKSPRETTLDGKLEANYNSMRFSYNITEHLRQSSGEIVQFMVHNIDALSPYLHNSKYVETYTIVDNVLTINQRVSKGELFDNLWHFTLVLNIISGDFSATYMYDDMGYDFDFRMTKETERSDMSITLNQGENSLILLTYTLTPTSFVSTANNHLISPEFDVNFSTEFAQAGQIEMSLTSMLELAGVQHSLEGHDQITFSEEQVGWTTTMTYNGARGASLNLESTMTGRRNENRGSITYSMTNRKVIPNVPKRSSLTIRSTPESMNANLAYGQKRLGLEMSAEAAESYTFNAHVTQENFKTLRKMSVPGDMQFVSVYGPSSMRASASMDEVNVLEVNYGTAEPVLRISNLAGDALLMVTGTYTLTPDKSFTAHVLCSPLEVDTTISSELLSFQRASGNSTFEFSVRDNIRNQQFRIAAYLQPTSTEALDFVGEISATSSYLALPFTSRLYARSTIDSSAQGGAHVLKMSLDDSEISIRDTYTPTDITVTVRQPYAALPQEIVIEGSMAAQDDYRVKTLDVTWGSDDNVHVETRSKCAALLNDYSISISLPSAARFSEFNAKFLLDQMATTDKFIVQLNSNLDQFALGINTSYTGVLPNYYGAHDLEVDIIQPIFFSIPRIFKTRGQMEFSATGLYHSDWRITSQTKKELVVLRKMFTPTENGYNLEFLWKQGFSLTPGRYISLVSDGSSSGTGVQGRASLSIDALPTMSGNMQYNSESDDSFTNNSVSAALTTGPLSKWLILRTLSVATWFKSESNDRQTAPSFGLTVIPDGQEWVLNGAFEKSSGRRSNKVEAAFTFNHPLELFLFQVTLPRENTGSIAVLKRGKGASVVTKYRNNLMQDEMKMTTRYRTGSAENLFEGSTAIESGANNVFSTSVNVGQDEPNNGYNINMRMTCPSSGIDGNVVLNTFNSVERIGFSAIAKDYSNTVKTWERRFAYMKQTNIIEFYQNGPDMSEPITLRGDISQVIAQAKQVMRNLAEDASHVRLEFLKGVTATADGYDIKLGYAIENDATYTIHLVVGAQPDNMYAKLETRINNEIDTTIARADINLADARLIQLRFSANPVITNFLSKMIDESDVEFTRKVTWLASNVIQLLESVKTVVTGDEQLSTIVNAYVDGLIVKVENARDAAIRIVTSVSSKLTGGIGSSELTLEQLVRTGITNLLNSITALKQTVTQPFEQLVQQYYGQFLTRLNTEMAASLAPVTAALRKIHAGDLFIELVQEATANTLRFVMTNGEATLVASRVPLTDLFVVTSSEVIFNIPLKFELDHFTPMPTLSDIQTWLAQSAFSIQIDETVNMLYSYVDDYYRARAIMLMPRDEMLPPFKGHSFVSGFKHFSTFDKRSYDFSSACATTHILAADHRNGNFTVSLAYADPALENSMNSLEVIVENRRVSISSDYKVRVGDRIKQLPLTVGKMSVSLEGHTVHVRHIEGDVDVACDFTKQLCTVDVSPYYFGATAGLAGTFNNEPMDDFTSPAHELLTTPGQLATAWEASSTECAQNTAAPSVPECNSATRQAVCEAIFKSKNSVHRGCFPLVDPTPFMEMCMADMCNEEDQTKSCAASAAYGYRCGLLGASFGQPDHCITCTAANGDTFDASSSNVEAEVTGIDVVMVVEEGRCMGRSGISKAFKKIFKKLYAGLSDSRMRNTRYRLVGYGGSGANNEPHSYTIRSKLSTVRKNDLLKSLRKLSLSSEAIQVDPLAAISYASQLSFRAGAKPVIVLLSCDQCSSTSKVSYSNVEWQLREQGITLHHLTHNSIEGARKSIYGFDGEHVYTRQDRAESLSIVKPNKQDVCVPLATSTGGSVWDASFLTSSDFSNKVGNYIGTRHSRSSHTCQCKLNAAGISTAVCT